MLTVRNTGNPIPPELAGRIFEPLLQLGQRIGGVGLGLFITREIVRAHGGSIEMTSDERAGTAFQVRVPRGLAVGSRGLG